MAMLEVNGLVKTYRGFSLGPVDLTLDAGCAMGLVGANGAGKTTLFRSIITTVRRDQGSVLVDGIDANASSGLWRQRIGYVGDFTPLFQSWSGQKNLEAFARFYPDWSQDQALELAQRLNLDLTQKAKNYSTGQQAKLAIIIALAHKPSLLLLDEPTSGLDPISRDVFMELLFERMESNQVAMLYATHHISEIEQLADRLAFLSNGQIVRNEIKENLVESWRRVTFRSEQALEQIPHVMHQKAEHPYYDLISEDGDATIQYLNSRGVESIESSRLSAEKIAVQILKDAERETGNV